MSNLEKVLELANSNGGTITNKEIDTINVFHSTILHMVKIGLLEHSSRGVYILPSQFDDEFYNLQVRLKKGIFSNVTALYLLGFTDRTPIKFDMTFPASYNTTKLKSEIIPHRVKNEFYKIGIIKVSTPFNNKVNVYCIEHTLCDILKQKYNIDIGIIADAFKKYAKYNKKNLPLLSQFAKDFKVEKKVRSYLEVLI